MDSKLQSALAMLLTKLTEGVENAINIGVEQFPIVVQEFLQYEAIKYNTWFWFWTILAVISLLIFFIYVSKDVRYGDWVDNINGTSFIMFLCVTIFSGFSITCYLKTLKIQVAPKVYVIDELFRRWK